jgi:hypothetical protein
MIIPFFPLLTLSSLDASLCLCSTVNPNQMSVTRRGEQHTQDTHVAMPSPVQFQCSVRMGRFAPYGALWSPFFPMLAVFVLECVTISVFLLAKEVGNGPKDSAWPYQGSLTWHVCPGVQRRFGVQWPLRVCSDLPGMQWPPRTGSSLFQSPSLASKPPTFIEERLSNCQTGTCHRL